ncbi:hypothetical protein HPULCUR_003739 [Helicostylum pulchrum]|uniref:Uncharacterized protein n=1 Tax=Helicostylum pulchrum TaxID=562976 RepID=A0ABP9XWB2_9FUNG
MSNHGLVTLIKFLSLTEKKYAIPKSRDFSFAGTKNTFNGETRDLIKRGIENTAKLFYTIEAIEVSGSAASSASETVSGSFASITAPANTTHTDTTASNSTTVSAGTTALALTSTAASALIKFDANSISNTTGSDKEYLL